MKKIILASTAVIVIGGLAFCLKGVGAKSFEKENFFEVDRIEEIEINKESWNIEIKNTKSKKITIAVEGKQEDKKKDPVTIKDDEKKIVVNQKDQKGGFFEGFSFGKKGTIYISIPEDGIDTITMKNSSGDIKMNDVTTKNLVISNGSGTGKIEGLSANKGEFISKDGELSLKNSSLKELNIASNTGDNYITNVNSPEIKVTSKDGEVSIKDIKEGKSLFVETKSGDIAVSYKKAPTSLAFTANSDSSDITVNLDGFKKRKNTGNLIEGMIGNGTNKVELLSRKGVINVK
ncbi:DUF4097 family beta strand repeat-containing protein [Bacillus cereus]|uniref:DUF4097 family beta strand repeat-containing protein n=1 Tax=Bacillus cereus TaxID=1396 RepID=UPI000BF2DA67|nr:DUF4097 family beta strand repeat-containing protein [Bacillus cereus]PEX86964.1 hypothetical protein CN450_15555 [Bacillus cereus]